MIHDLPSTPGSFPFLRLPAEIRNKIYRLLLLTQHVTTEAHNANRSYRSPGEGAGGVHSVQPGEVAFGTIRCNSWRKYTMEYQISILRANRQIYHETWGIFHFENFWTVVRINKAGFGKEIQDRGFPVATAGNLWRDIKFPVMKVTVTFPSLEDRRESDSLLVATVYLTQLMRTLWTAKGAAELEVIIHVQPRVTKDSPNDRDLLGPFFKLRNIKKLIIFGVSEQKDIDDLTWAITKTDGINRSFRGLTVGVTRLQEYIRAQQWDSAVWEGEKQAILLSDCRLVYGNRFVGIDPSININTAMVRSRTAREIILATAMAIAEVTLYLRQYANTICFADRVLNLVSRVASVQPAAPPNPAVAVPPLAGAIALENETRCHVLLLRARAQMGMRRAELAFRDIEEARELMPDSLSVASATETWQANFGPSTGSTPLPAAILSSALVTSFASALDGMEYQ